MAQQSSQTETPMILAALGSAMLFIGAFLPVFKGPIIGELNYFNNGKGDGVIIVILAVVSLIFAIVKLYQALFLTGFGAFCVIAFSFINLQNKISDVQRQMSENLEGNPFRGAGEAMAQSFQMQYGWAILAVGALLIFGGALSSLQQQPVQNTSATGGQEAQQPPIAMIVVIGLVAVGIILAGAYFYLEAAKLK